MEPDQKEFIDIVFGNDPFKGTDYFFTDAWDKKSADWENRVSEDAALELNLTHFAFTEYEAWADNFSPAQIAMGLELIFNSSLSNLGFCFAEKQIEEEKAVATIGGLGRLIIEKFETSAPQILSHLRFDGDGNENELISHMTYMFWDTATIPHKCSKKIQNACFEVMAACTRSKNIALVESGLHGLGHAVQEYGQTRLRPYFSRVNFHGNQMLKAYAHDAMLGAIQ